MRVASPLLPPRFLLRLTAMPVWRSGMPATQATDLPSTRVMAHRNTWKPLSALDLLHCTDTPLLPCARLAAGRRALRRLLCPFFDGPLTHKPQKRDISYPPRG